MRTAVSGYLTALALGLLTATASAQSPDRFVEQPSGSWDWFGGLFGSSKQANKSKPGEVPAGPTVEQRDAERERLERIFYRRQKVCDRLREIALQTDNPRLEEQAAELEEQAWKLYYEQANRLLGVRSASASENRKASKPVEQASKKLQLPSDRGPLPSRFRSDNNSQWSNRREDPR